MNSVVTSDYGALHATQGALQGTDMEQPENTYYGTALSNAIRKGTIPRSALNTMVQRILTQMFGYNLFSQPRTGSTSATVTTPADQAVGATVAEESTTLLKNAGPALPLPAANAGTVAVIGSAASASPVYAGGGSAYVIPSSTVTPLAGIQAAAGPGTNVVYSQGLPTDTSLPSIPSSSLYPAYSATPSGGSYTGTPTAPETGTYVLALTNPCGCYTSTYLSLNGQQILDDPSTPPVHTYSVAVSLAAGQQYTLSISGQSSQLLWGTPPALAPSINAAVSAARSASTAVVVVFDDTESEAADRTQTEGAYNVYLGDSSALSSLPLQGTFTMAATPAARQVVVTAPSTMQPGQAATVQVQLTASGDQALPDVQLALQLPQGWTAAPTGPTEFTSVAPGTAPTATFQVTPPSYAPNASAVVHATATMGDMAREAGVTVTVS
jgi:hypothetical protein